MKRISTVIAVLAIGFLAVLIGGCQKYGKVINLLDKINDENSRYWKEFITENGIDAFNENRQSILWVAVNGNNAELTEAVLEAGADPNRSGGFDGLGNVALPLRLAAFKGNMEIVKSLLKHKALPVAYNTENGKVVFDIMEYAISNPELFDIIIPYYKGDMLDYSGKRLGFLSVLTSGFSTWARDSVPLETEVLDKLPKSKVKLGLETLNILAENVIYSERGIYEYGIINLNGQYDGYKESARKYVAACKNTLDYYLAQDYIKASLQDDISEYSALNEYIHPQPSGDFTVEQLTAAVVQKIKADGSGYNTDGLVLKEIADNTYEGEVRSPETGGELYVIVRVNGGLNDFTVEFAY